MPRLSRRQVLQTVCGFASLALAGCTETTTPGGTDTLSPAPASTPTTSPTPTATGPPDLPFETVDANECQLVTLPQPAPTEQFQPREYPDYPETLTRQTAEGFARSFENAYEYNRYLATRSNVKELSYSPTVRRDLTEPLRDGFLIAVDGVRGTLDDEAYADDPVVGVYFVTPEYALRGDIERPTLSGVDSLGSVEVTKQRTISCGSGSATKVKERALAAEEAYISEELENASCVDEWGLTDYGGWGKEATPINRSSDGVYVEVRHPYWFGTEELEADAGSEATYLVTDNGVQRLGGTKVSPC